MLKKFECKEVINMRNDGKNCMVLEKYINKEVTIFVRYGFKKRVEETQSYQGKLIFYDEFGIIIERFLRGAEDKVHDFFPWHNIDGLRFQY